MGRDSLLSKKNIKLLRDPLNDNNPITIQVSYYYTEIQLLYRHPTPIQTPKV